MVSPDSGALRLARACGFGVSAFSLALAAHVAGGGQAPAPVGFAVLAFATVWASVFLTWRKLSRPAILLALGAAQLALHQAFGWASPSGSCVTVVHGHADHLTSGAVTICSEAAPAAVAHHGVPGLLMMAAHAVAALLLGFLLACGEAAVWFLAELVWPALPAAAPFHCQTRSLGAARAAVYFSRPVLGRGGVGRRGPPLLGAACCAS
jgi:hypothetical protein